MIGKLIRHLPIFVMVSVFAIGKLSGHRSIKCWIETVFLKTSGRRIPK